MKILFLTFGAKARKTSNQASWDSFCRLPGKVVMWQQIILMSHLMLAMYIFICVMYNLSQNNVISREYVPVRPP